MLRSNLAVLHLRPCAIPEARNGNISFLDFRAFGEFAVMHFPPLLRSQSQALLKQPLVARTLYQSVHYRSLIQQKHLVHRWSRWCHDVQIFGLVECAWLVRTLPHPTRNQRRVKTRSVPKFSMPCFAKLLYSRAWLFVELRGRSTGRKSCRATPLDLHCLMLIMFRE